MLEWIAMEKTIRVFKSFEEAETADREYYRSLTPAERIQIVLMLRERYRASNKLPNNFQRVCRIVERTDLLTADEVGHEKAQKAQRVEVDG